MVDEARQRRSELLAVTMNFDLHWYSISESPGEEGGGASDGVSPEGLTLERLATLKRSEFSTALRKLDHCTCPIPANVWQALRILIIAGITHQ